MITIREGRVVTLKGPASTMAAAGLAVDLVAVLVTVTDGEPRALTIRDGL